MITPRATSTDSRRSLRDCTLNISRLGGQPPFVETPPFRLAFLGPILDPRVSAHSRPRAVRVALRAELPSGPCARNRPRDDTSGLGERAHSVKRRYNKNSRPNWTWQMFARA